MRAPDFQRRALAACVAMAVAGAMPNSRTSKGVINAPPPTPVRPTTKPVQAPARA